MTLKLDEAGPSAFQPVAPKEHQAVGSIAVDPIRMGSRLRQVRWMRGVKLRELAAMAGCSESLLSKVENGKANPSLTTLHRIAAALGTNIAAFFPKDHDQEKVVSLPEDRPTFLAQDDGIRLERLVSSAESHLLQGYIHWIKPGGGYEGEVVQHQGEELGYVLEGEIELMVDGRTYVAATGASFHFRSELPHSIRNAGGIPAKVIWVSTPPTF